MRGVIRGGGGFHHSIEDVEEIYDGITNSLFALSITIASNLNANERIAGFERGTGWALHSA